jgi:hypothetical protein
MQFALPAGYFGQADVGWSHWTPLLLNHNPRERNVGYERVALLALLILPRRLLAANFNKSYKVRVFKSASFLSSYKVRLLIISIGSFFSAVRH